MYSNRVFCEKIIRLTKKESDINPFELVDEAERFYKSIKIVGLSNTIICLLDDKGQCIEKTGEDIPVEVREIVFCLIKILEGEEKHLREELDISETTDTKCENIKEFIEEFLDK